MWLVFLFLKSEESLCNQLNYEIFSQAIIFTIIVSCVFIFLFRMVNLLKDFVESEFFLIDGDSLFITCVFNVNFKKGQTLHFFYIVEQFLHDFIQKEARFVIVFFKVTDRFNSLLSFYSLRKIFILKCD